MNAELRAKREAEQLRKDRAAEKERSKGGGLGGGGQRNTKVYGDMNGLDDPRGVAWRRKAESIIRSTVEGLAADGGGVPGAEVYDITWNIGDLQVTHMCNFVWSLRGVCAGLSDLPPQHNRC